VIQSSGLTANFSGPPTIVLDPKGGTTTLAAHDRLLPGPSYAMAPGFITQLRIENPIVSFQFTDGSSLPVRVPSGPETGWKVIVDETTSPNGYQIVAGHTTGVRLFLTLGELFHKTGGGGSGHGNGHGNGNGNGHGKGDADSGTGGGHGNSDMWMARPTIQSSLYNIVAGGGYDPDILVVVFDPATDDATIASAITSGGYTVVNQYPNAPPKLYKIQLPAGGNLQDAHMYFRSLSYVLAAAPSVIMTPRADVLPPNEGIPNPLAVIGAEAGWTKVEGAPSSKGTVGTPTAVVAEISLEGLNTHHTSLLPNLWLNQDEILAVCPTQCDVDGDGFVTLRDFNYLPPHKVIPTKFMPTSGTPGTITCEDLRSSQYSNGIDDPPPGSPPGTPGNGFVDDLCGWNFNFTKGKPATGGGSVFSQVASSAAHDTAVAGIIGARGDLAPTMTVPPGAGVGVCWNCRIMVLAATPGGSTFPDGGLNQHGLTFEFLAALAYATQNGAHVANYSAGITLNPSNHLTCGSGNGSGVSVDKAAFTTATGELTTIVQSHLMGAEMGGKHAPLVTLAIDDRCTNANVDDNDPNTYDFPPAAFRGGSFAGYALTVAGSVNTMSSPGAFAGQSSCAPNNKGADIAAPEVWELLLLDATDNGASFGGGGSLGCSGALPGSSLAAPVVAGVAGLIVSANPGFATPNGLMLRQEVVDHHVTTNALLGTAVMMQREIDMSSP
jgi:hypothetical protein